MRIDSAELLLAETRTSEIEENSFALMMSDVWPKEEIEVYSGLRNGYLSEVRTTAACSVWK